MPLALPHQHPNPNELLPPRASPLVSLSFSFPFLRISRKTATNNTHISPFYAAVVDIVIVVVVVDVLFIVDAIVAAAAATAIDVSYPPALPYLHLLALERARVREPDSRFFLILLVHLTLFRT